MLRRGHAVARRILGRLDQAPKNGEGLRWRARIEQHHRLTQRGEIPAVAPDRDEGELDLVFHDGGATVPGSGQGPSLGGTRSSVKAGRW